MLGARIDRIVLIKKVRALVIVLSNDYFDKFLSEFVSLDNS